MLIWIVEHRFETLKHRAVRRGQVRRMPWWSSKPFGSEAAPDSFSTDAEPIPYQYRTGNTPVPHRAHRKLAAAETVKIVRGRLSGRALLRTTWKSEIVKLQTQNDSIMPLASAHLDTLNTEQRRAVEHGVSEGNCASGGPLLVIAGAGSGKTNTLAQTNIAKGDGR